MSQSFRSPPVTIESGGVEGSSSIAVSTSANGPGSNGYNRRKMWLHRGAFSWTVPTGVTKIKIAALGAGGGANRHPGAGGGLAIGEYTVTAGQVISITVGIGGAALSGSTAIADTGGTTTVACLAASINMVANGGAGARDNSGVAQGGTATGGNIVNSKGGNSAGKIGAGGSSSGTPWGNGANNPSTYPKYGGLGWGTYIEGDGNTTLSLSDGGDSCHFKTFSYVGAPGLTVKTGNLIDDPHGQSNSFWDLEDGDGSGGSAANSNNNGGGHGGFGSGGGAAQITDFTTFNYGGNGGFGGGGGGSRSIESTLWGRGGNGGNGGGGGGGGGGNVANTTGSLGGSGGDGAAIIWF